MACQVHAGGLLRTAGLRPPGDLYVVGAVLEECGGLGSKHLARTVKTDCAVVGEPSANTLRRGHRGRVGIIAEVQARIYYEARGRPPYKIRRVVQNPAQPLRRAVPGRW